MRSFVFVLNHRFCLNSASDWSVILTFTSQNTFCVFSDEFEELIKIILFKTVLYVLIRYGIRWIIGLVDSEAVNAYGSVFARGRENPCEHSEEGWYTIPCELNSQFLGIPRNSQKFLIMQITLANWIPSFLGIPRNSQKFSTMQISSDLKTLELLGISGKARLQFCADLEFLGILSYTNYP